MAKAKLWVIGAVFLGVVAFLIFSGLKETTVYYYTVDEVLSGKYKAGLAFFRISGTVQQGSVKRESDSLSMEFKMADQEGGQAITVRFRGMVPDNFKEGMQVVAEGEYTEAKRSFEAGNLLLKCPSKYEKPK